MLAPHDLAWLDAEPPMLTRGRVQELTGLCLRTVDRAIASGGLRVTRFGRRVLVPREALRAYLTERGST